MNLETLLKFDDALTLEKSFKQITITSIANLINVTESSLLFVGNKKFWEGLLTLKVMPALVIVDAKFWEKLKIDDEAMKFVEMNKINIIVSKNFSVSISKISKPFYDQKFEGLNTQVDGRKMGTTNIHPSSRISENVFIGENVTIGENTVILPGVTIMPNCEIGNNCTIYPNVAIYSFTKIGHNVRIHSGTVIGADGFGYNFFQGTHLKVWHMGGVEISNHVEIGSNCSIDQGTFSPTKIGEGTKIDNQVQIAHNVIVGKGVILCGQVGLAGSSKVGDYTVFGGKAALADQTEIGAKCQVAGNCMVTNDWPDGSVLGGHPARPLNEWMRGLAFIRKNSIKKGDS